MRRDERPFEDDGRVIADMSALRGSTRDELSEHGRDVREELGDQEEQLMVILGTMRAALSIGMVYVVGFGIAILLMVLLWT